MKEMCDYCEKMVELKPTYVTSHCRIDDDTVVPIEVQVLRCPECGDGNFYKPTSYEYFQIQKMLIRGKHKLLHWQDIVEFQKWVGWTDEYLAEFINEPLPIEVRLSNDWPLKPVYDLKLRAEMKKCGYTPKWDKIE